MSRKDNYKSKANAFGNLYHLIDSLMLFGGTLEQVTDIEYHLVLRKSPSSHPSLAWAIITAESQDPAFDFLRFQPHANGKDHLRFRTRATRFLSPVEVRWYKTTNGKRQLNMPVDCILDIHSLLFWVLGAIRPGKGVVSLPCPVLGEEELAARMKQIATLTGWACSRGENTIRVPREPVEAWLTGRVPEKVWRH